MTDVTTVTVTVAAADLTHPSFLHAPIWELFSLWVSQMGGWIGDFNGRLFRVLEALQFCYSSRWFHATQQAGCSHASAVLVVISDAQEARGDGFFDWIPDPSLA